MIALDTNLLVYAFLPGVREHVTARKAMEDASDDPRGWGVALSSIAEFWLAVTHPSAVGGPSPLRAARGFLDALIAEGPGILWMPKERFSTRLMQMATDLEVRGPRIFDLQIALTAFDNGATEIWTHDRGFVAFPGLAVHDPL
jgi:predicted nucleic acid-binding protein